MVERRYNRRIETASLEQLHQILKNGDFVEAYLKGDCYMVRDSGVVFSREKFLKHNQISPDTLIKVDKDHSIDVDGKHSSTFRDYEWYHIDGMVAGYVKLFLPSGIHDGGISLYHNLKITSPRKFEFTDFRFDELDTTLYHDTIKAVIIRYHTNIAEPQQKS